MEEADKKKHSSSFDDIRIEQHLPDDVILSIVLQLPLEDIKNFCFVNKYWNRTVSEEAFVQKRNDLEVDKQNPSYVLLTKVRPPRPMYAIERNALISPSASTGSRVRTVKFPFESGMPPILSIVGSCKGIICLKLGTTHSSSFCCLWNPVTREIIKLPNPPLVRREIVCCFCYDEIMRDYKITRVVHSESRTPQGMLQYQVHTYSLNSNTWRMIEGVTSFGLGWLLKPAIYHNNSVHWLAGEDGILLLDLHENMIGAMETPRAINLAGQAPLVKKMGLLKGFLTLVTQNVARGDVTLWVMQSYGACDSWCKMFTTEQEFVRRPLCMDAPLGSLQLDDVLFVNDMGLVSYSPEFDHASKLVLLTDEGDEVVEVLQATSYVGSLDKLWNPKGRVAAGDDGTNVMHE